MNHAVTEWTHKYGKRAVEIVAVLAVVIFLIALVWGPSPAQAPVSLEEELVPALDTQEVVASTDGTTPAVVTAPVKTTKPSSVSKPLTYEQAIDTYGKYRIQFVNCNGQPGSMNVPVRTKVMLDNRDTTAHTVLVGSKSYRLPSLGFAIATMSTVGEYAVLCDGGGASSINVQ